MNLKAFLHYTSKDIARICEGQHFGSSRDVEHFIYDSRRAAYNSNSCFLALKGRAQNGHYFIPALLTSGLEIFLVDKKESIPGDSTATFILVKDVLIAIQELAKNYRSNHNARILAITGSHGKTITKEWIHQLNQHRKNVYRSPGSFNSQLGVPLSILQMPEITDFAIIEAGISTYGEMERLSEIISPDEALITNIGSPHAMGFDSESDKLNEKLKLMKGASPLYYSSTQKSILTQIEQQYASSTQLSWGNTVQDDLRVLSVEGNVLALRWKDNQSFTVRAPGEQKSQIENFLHAALVSLAHGMSPDELVHQAEKLQPLNMRLEMKEGLFQNRLINDSYSGDFESLRDALDYLMAKKKGGPGIVVLSIFEEYEHELSAFAGELQKLLQRHEIDKLYYLGPEIETEDFSSLTKFVQFRDQQSLSQHLRSHPPRGATILFKGARKFRLERLVSQLELQSHSTRLEINLAAIAHNISVFRGIVGANCKIMAMIKAYAYGAGALELAELLQEKGVEYIGVAYADEGIALRKAGIQLPIMVMNPASDAFQKMFQYQLEPEIYSLDLLAKLISEVRLSGVSERIKIHLAFDTGMHRLGFEPKEIPDLMHELKEHSAQLEVSSVFSHFTSSEDRDAKEDSQEQIDLFDAICSELQQGLNQTFDRHIANSAGILNFPVAHYEMVRPGLGLHGISSDPELRSKLRPALRFISEISQVKSIKLGESVGYNRSWKAKEDTRIATIPVGYADGYDLRFSNGIGKVLINNCECPVVGKVCMDMVMVEIGSLNCQAGDEVVLIDEKLNVEELAKSIGSIPYELLTGFSSRIKRVFIHD